MSPLGNPSRAVLLLGACVAVPTVAGAAIGTTGALVGLALGLALSAMLYLRSDKLVLRMHHARPLPADEAPDAYALLAELARRARIPQPELWVTPESPPNAFATGRGAGAIVLSKGLLLTLSPRQLRNVLAHELAHIRRRDVIPASVAAVMAASVTGLAALFSFQTWFGTAKEDRDEKTPLGLVFLLVAPVAALLLHVAGSRSREHAADDEAVRLTGDPDALADALEAISASVGYRAEPATSSLRFVNPLSEGRLALFSTHPPVHERIRRLRALVPPDARHPFRDHPAVLVSAGA